MSSPMSLDESLAPRRTALVMWDFQVGLAGQAANLAELTEQVPTLLAGARAAGCRVVWSRHVGLPPAELSPAMSRAEMTRQGSSSVDGLAQYMPDGSPEGEWVDWVAPVDGEVVIAKSFPTFFVGTRLEYLLRAWSTDTLVLAGVATDHGIDLTARHGLALGLTSVVVADATGSFTDQAHQDALARLSGMAEVATVAQCITAWGDPRHATRNEETR